MNEAAPTLEGRLIAVAGKADLTNVNVWFAYQSVSGEKVTATTRSDDDGRFSFTLPETNLAQARVGAELEGVSTVDLEPEGRQLEPGDVVLIVDDIVPSHLRYGGA